MSGSYLRYEKSDNVVVLTMNRPEQRNALIEVSDMLEFTTQFAAINADMEARAIVLTGAGQAFCAGGNVKVMHEIYGPHIGPAAAIQALYRDGIQQIARAFALLEVPIIAAVNGAAIGGGCDISCMCDIRLCSDKASFGETYLRLGIIPGTGGTWFLPRAVGLSRACEMTFTGDVIDAQTAQAYGLVSRVVAADKLMDEAMGLARRIAANPPHQLRMAKKLLRRAQQVDLHTQLELTTAYQSLAHRTADHVEGINALLEKRRPVFTGQ
jgi:enoyl-CoA hydratase/carnithine racemase